MGCRLLTRQSGIMRCGSPFYWIRAVKAHKRSCALYSVLIPQGLSNRRRIMLKSTFRRPSSFQDVLNFVGDRKRVKIAHNTWLVCNLDGTISMYYHNTPILNYSENEVTYNSGDYRTVTTKRRFNQFGSHASISAQIRMVFRGRYTIQRLSRQRLYRREYHLIRLASRH